MFNRAVLAASGTLLLAAAANAADMYSGPASVSSYKDGPAYAGADWSGAYAGVNGGWGRIDENGAEGGFGGGQIGFNFQRGVIVFGAEADIQGSDVSKGKGQLDYFGTVRGRAGFASGRALIYSTGGLAYGKASCVDQDCGYAHAGYTIGAGVEYQLAPAWSVKAEYQYMELTDFPQSPDGRLAMDTVRAGVNYRIGGSYVPLK